MGRILLSKSVALRAFGIALLSLVFVAGLLVYHRRRLKAETTDRYIRMGQALEAMYFPWGDEPLPDPIVRNAVGNELASWRFVAHLFREPTRTEPRLDLPWDAVENEYFAKMQPIE